jgi:hypothetical protein
MEQEVPVPFYTRVCFLCLHIFWLKMNPVLTLTWYFFKILLILSNLPIKTAKETRNRDYYGLKYFSNCLNMSRPIFLICPPHHGFNLCCLNIYNSAFSGVFRKIVKSDFSFVMSVCPSFRPSAWSNWAPTGQIFITFDIWVFFENMSTKFKFP